VVLFTSSCDGVEFLHKVMTHTYPRAIHACGVRRRQLRAANAGIRGSHRQYGRHLYGELDDEGEDELDLFQGLDMDDDVRAMVEGSTHKAGHRKRKAGAIGNTGEDEKGNDTKRDHHQYRLIQFADTIVEGGGAKDTRGRGTKEGRGKGRGYSSEEKNNQQVRLQDTTTTTTKTKTTNDPGGDDVEVPILKLHGNMPQGQRTSTFVRFVRAETGVLICTDVAARGLDFPAVSTIIQFDPPGEPQEYVHRVGRTARMGQRGESIMLLLPSELDYVKLLRSKGVSINRTNAEQVLRSLPIHELGRAEGKEAAIIAKKKVKRADGGMKFHQDVHDASSYLMTLMTNDVEQDEELKKLAEAAFRSYVRAYSVHPASVREIFHVKKLHLGHVAHAFNLKETPSMVGTSLTKEQAQERRKKQMLDKKSKMYKLGSKVGVDAGYNLAH